MLVYRVLLKSPGPLPPYFNVAQHLWGADCDFDSEGDSDPADSPYWTELTLRLRPDLDQRIDIDPHSIDPLVLVIRSTDELLAMTTAEYLQARAGGEIVRLAAIESKYPDGGAAVERISD